MIRVVFLTVLSAAPALHLVDDFSRSTLTVGEDTGEKTTCCLELHPLNGIQKLLGCSDFSGHEGPCKGGVQVTIDGKGAGCGAPALFRATWKAGAKLGFSFYMPVTGEIDDKDQWKGPEIMTEAQAQEFEEGAKSLEAEAEKMEAEAKGLTEEDMQDDMREVEEMRKFAAQMRQNVDWMKKSAEAFNLMMRKRSEVLKRRWKSHVALLLDKVGKEKPGAKQLDIRYLVDILLLDAQREAQAHTSQSMLDATLDTVVETLKAGGR